jgi:hypothetical protein
MKNHESADDFWQQLAFLDFHGLQSQTADNSWSTVLLFRFRYTVIEKKVYV